MKDVYCYLTVLVILVAAFSGCQKRSAGSAAPPPFRDDKVEYVLTFVLDLSKKYSQHMGEDARSYNFFQKVSEKFFRQRMGEDDRILISQMSGRERALIWEGKPTSMRRHFPTSLAFNQFLERKSDPSGARVYAALADTFEYLAKRHDVDTETMMLTVILSDMIDISDGNTEEDRARMIDSLRNYRVAGGQLVLYWVDPSKVDEWDEILDEAGFPPRIWMDFVEDPEIPEFEA